MKILILHRIPYHKIDYHRGIDHNKHEVIYVGTSTALQNIPPDLKCKKVARSGKTSASVEILDLVNKGAFGVDSFDLVISLSEYELLEAAKIRDALNIRGASYEDTLLVRDKVLMKEAVSKAGVRVPAFAKLNDVLAHIIKPNWQGPTVLKPKDGASSENVKIYSSLMHCLDEIRNDKTSISNFAIDQFQIEEFILGPIIHIDGLVSHSEISCWLPSEYLGTCLDYANGKPLGSFQLPPNKEFLDFTENVLQAVRIKEGSFHLEAILTEQGLVFLEVANRVGGADVVDTFERATRIFLPAAELSSLVGDVDFYSFNKGHKLDTQAFGWFVFPGHHLPEGKSKLIGFDKYREDSHLLRFNELKDQKLPRQITYQSVDVPLAGVATAVNSILLKEWMQNLLSEIKVESISY